jgi:hypothetical protein
MYLLDGMRSSEKLDRERKKQMSLDRFEKQHQNAKLGHSLARSHERHPVYRKPSGIAEFQGYATTHANGTFNKLEKGLVVVRTSPRKNSASDVSEPSDTSRTSAQPVSVNGNQRMSYTDVAKRLSISDFGKRLSSETSKRGSTGDASNRVTFSGGQA